MKHACHLLVLVTLLASPRSHAQTDTQSWELHPGWNALWLEVEPADRAPAVVFAGLPIHSVWTWADRVSATDFIQNPADAGWNRAQWLSYFPDGTPEAVLSNLRAILPQRAYLVKLGGTQTIRWSISGRPILRTPKWASDAYNLRGFPIDPAGPPTFRSFFRASPAHYDAASDQLQPIFVLGTNGLWTAVAPDAPMQRGVAYWVHTRGASDYVAPFHLELTTGDHLDFDATVGRIRLTIYNRHPLAKLIRIASATSTDSPLLLLPRTELGKTNAPVPLKIHQQALAPAATHRLLLGIDRSRLGVASRAVRSAASVPAPHTNLLAVSDGEGTLFHLGLTALASPASDFTGLWIGTATLTNVAAVADSGSTNDPGTVLTPFPLRLLLHVDSGGQVSLLRDVTLLYNATNPPAPATSTNPPSTAITSPPLRPSRLITDPAILTRLSPADLRAGRLNGRRLTAPHFDFALPPGEFQLPLTGVFALSNQLTGELSIPPDLPTNPFLHRYHPDHGTNRAYAVTREIHLLLGVAANVPPGEGDEALGGSYSETVTGLHKQPLISSGSLFLRRISDVGTLNVP